MPRIAEPLFNPVSYARRGPGQRISLTPAQIHAIARTVARTPEVMVKVLPRGATTLAAVQKHVDYIGREGELEIESDAGEGLRGERVGETLVEDWDLDVDAHRRQSRLTAINPKPPRLVHKLVFSMPAGTPPKKILSAVQTLCREEFGLWHRYALALHTDEPHPHVHVIVKALSERGDRLHLSNEILRHWRAEFARHLRALGVAANATPRFVRGETKPRKSDAVYRSVRRGHSTHMRSRALAVATELRARKFKVESGKATLIRSRKVLNSAWIAVGESLDHSGQPQLAAQVRQFISRLPPARTEKEHLAAVLIDHLRQSRVKEHPHITR